MYQFFSIEIILISNHVLFVCVREREKERACYMRSILRIHHQIFKPSAIVGHLVQ